MTRQRLSSLFLRASGLLVMLLGLVHLAATPHIPALLDGLSPKARAFAVGPTVLNHILVGVLLLPLGFTAFVAAAERHRGEAWARSLLAAYALTLLSLPAAILVFMRQAAFYQSPLFVAGVAITAATAVLVVLAVWVRGGRKPGSDAPPAE
jgi:hypothetical protein